MVLLVVLVGWPLASELVLELVGCGPAASFLPAGAAEVDERVTLMERER